MIKVQLFQKPMPHQVRATFAGFADSEKRFSYFTEQGLCLPAGIATAFGGCATTKIFSKPHLF
jgi:hypothetical protein